MKKKDERIDSDRDTIKTDTTKTDTRSRNNWTEIFWKLDRGSKFGAVVAMIVW